MSVAPVRAHLADAAGWNSPAGGARRFAMAFALVVAAHLALMIRPDAPAPIERAEAESPALSLQFARSVAVAAATPAKPQPPPPTPVTPPQATTALPDPEPITPPAPGAPVPAQAGSLLAVDPTAEPIQLTPSSAPPSAAAAPIVATAADAACDLTPALQAALQNDPALRDDLAAIPRQARSVADAIQFWDGSWIDPESIGGSTSADPIRAAIVAVVDQAPAACHDAVMQGPRLVAISDPRGTIMVAVGSGLWKWSDLAGSASPTMTP